MCCFIWLEFNCIQNFIWKRFLERKTEKKKKRPQPLETSPVPFPLPPLACFSFPPLAAQARPVCGLDSQRLLAPLARPNSLSRPNARASFSSFSSADDRTPPTPSTVSSGPRDSLPSRFSFLLPSVTGWESPSPKARHPISPGFSRVKIKTAPYKAWCSPPRPPLRF